MGEDKDTDAPSAPEPLKPRRNRRRAGWRRVLGAGLGGALALCIVLLGFVAFALTDRDVTAPSWLRAQIQTRLAEVAPDLDIKFGEMFLTLSRNRAPQVSLRDVAIAQRGGADVLALSALQTRLAVRPLLRGEVRPTAIDLSGVVATLTRSASGEVDLITTTSATGASRRAATLADLVGEIDQLFLRPGLTDLTDMSVNGVTLRFEDARAKRVWTIDGARMRLAREGDNLALSGDLALLSGGADVATLAANYTTIIGTDQARFGITVEDLPAADLAAFSPAFGWLGGLQAPVSGALRGGIEDSGALLPLSATLQIGKGKLQPTAQTRPIRFDAARTYFTFDPATNDLVFDEISVDSAWVRGRGEGRAYLAGLETGVLRELVGQFELVDLEINPPDHYPEPLLLDGAEVDLRLTPSPFRIDLGRARLLDGERDLTLSGRLLAAQDGWQVALDGHTQAVRAARLLELWPRTQVPRTRAWLLENLHAGELSDLQIALRSAPGGTAQVFVGFDFDETELTFLRNFPDLTRASGSASLYDGRLVLTLNEGVVEPPEGGEVDVAGTSFIVPDVGVSDGAPAIVRLRTEASMTAALSLLDQPPLGLISRAGLPVQLAQGRVRAQTRIDLPLQRGVTGADIGHFTTATLRDVSSDVLVPERRLQADELQLAASPTEISVRGAGQMDGVPFEGTWLQALGPGGDGRSRVVADVEVSEASVTALGLGLPPGAVGGRGTARLAVELARDAPPDFVLQSDLSGISLRLPEVGWSLSPGSQGQLEVAGRLGEVPSIDVLSLEAPGLSASGAISFRPEGGGLARAAFDRVQIGGWLDAPVTLIGRGAGVSPEVRLDGGALDLRAASFGEGSGAPQSGPLALNLDRLQITDTIALTGFSGAFDLRQGLQGRFAGAVNGRAPVTGQVEPSAGRSAFRILSQDAGAVFSSAGLLKQARGGSLSLILSPVGSAGAFNGSMQVQDISIQDAPAIAALFSALSVVGLLEQMSGQGLRFSEVDAAFRLTPDRVTLTEAAAVGPSLGLSMNGTFDLNTSSMDMSGVFSPLYLVNGIGSLFTRRGEGLIGFNFNLTGPTSAPRVQVNPLSALTPAFFREIFRRPPPELELEPGEAPGSNPAVQPAPERRRREHVDSSDR